MSEPAVESAPRPPLLQDRFHWGNPGGYLLAWCPGCDGLHGVPTVACGQRSGPWSLEVDGQGRPTFSPSLLIHPWRAELPGHKSQPRCHSFLRAGAWHYLTDCEHALAGRVVEVPPIPEVEDFADPPLEPPAGP